MDDDMTRDTIVANNSDQVACYLYLTVLYHAFLVPKNSWGLAFGGRVLSGGKVPKGNVGI